MSLGESEGCVDEKVSSRSHRIGKFEVAAEFRNDWSDTATLLLQPERV
jgi:hypothetical protein